MTRVASDPTFAQASVYLVHLEARTKNTITNLADSS